MSHSKLKRAFDHRNLDTGMYGNPGSMPHDIDDDIDYGEYDDEDFESQEAGHYYEAGDHNEGMIGDSNSQSYNEESVLAAEAAMRQHALKEK